MNFSFKDRYTNYSVKTFQKDLISGIIVGIIAIPLGMAFSIASGVKPEYGLYTTIIAGICISLFGGSKFQIGGPTGAFIPILFAIVMQYGYENLLIAGFMAGVMLLLMGLFKMGSIIRFIPRPVILGFTAGIAVIIFTSQIANFLGLSDLEKHEDFISNMKEIAIHFHTLNGYSILTGFISFALVAISPRISTKLPGSLIGLLVSGILAFLCFPGEVSTIGSTFGEIPSQLPHVHFPQLTYDQVLYLIKPAFIIAMLGGIESLLSAVVADGMTGTKHNSNRELIGQGIANMLAPLFGGIPATGAIARTATNIKIGAASRVSGIIHGITVMLILLMFAPYASHIPLAGMAPILMVVAWNMSERKEFAHILKTKTADSLILVITFALTIFTNLTTAVEIGLLLSVIVFVKNMSKLHFLAKTKPTCPQVSIYTLEGPLFFGVVNTLEKAMMEEIKNKTEVLIIRMKNVPYIDTTAESNLSIMIKHFKHEAGHVLITGLQNQPSRIMEKTGLDKIIGPENYFERTNAAIHYSLTQIQTSRCLNCKHFAFEQCQQLSKPS